jgi:hypothetical protein
MKAISFSDESAVGQNYPESPMAEMFAVKMLANIEDGNILKRNTGNGSPKRR